MSACGHCGFETLANPCYRCGTSRVEVTIQTADGASRRLLDAHRRIARALAMLDGLRLIEHSKRCDSFHPWRKWAGEYAEPRAGACGECGKVREVHQACTCGLDEHNARVDALATALRGDDAGGEGGR